MEQKKAKVEAKLVGQTLVAVFEESQPPLVWQFDLEKNHSFTVALQRRENGWDIGVNLPENPFSPIGFFENYDAAQAAFEAVQEALMTEEGEAGLDVLNRFAMPIAIVLLAVVMAFGIWGPQAQHTNEPVTETVQQALSLDQKPKDGSPVAVIPGVPQAADDVLKPPADDEK